MLILDGEIVEPEILFDCNHVVFFEIVDGDYILEKLEEKVDVKEQGE